MSKETIRLESKELGVVEYQLDHAKRLIKLEHKIGKQNWLPLKDSDYKVINGSLIQRSNKGPSQEAEK